MRKNEKINKKMKQEKKKNKINQGVRFSGR